MKIMPWLLPAVSTLLLSSTLNGFAATTHKKLVSSPSYVIFGYYTNWDTYSGPQNENYQPSAIPVSYLTAGLYAFSEVGNCAPPYATDEQPTQCNTNKQNTGLQDFKLYSTDPYSDYNKIPQEYYDSEQSGLGNMSKFINALHSQKKAALLSIGGYTLSAPITALITDGSNITSFNNSVVSFLKEVQADNNQDGFDGVDIDWEPNAGQWSFLNTLDPTDAKTVLQNFLTLLSNLQSQLQTNYANYAWLTIATPASPAIIAKIEQIDPGFWQQVANTVDYIDVMAYDYHGGFDIPAITNFLAPLAADSNEPSGLIGGSTFNVQATIQAYLAANVPSNKLVLGDPLYARAVMGVPATAPQAYPNAIGLYQSFSGDCPGEFNDNSGFYDYKYIVGKLIGTSLQDYQIDGVGTAAYGSDSATNCNNAFFSYDNINDIKNKVAYIQNQHLAGMMFWELSGDVPVTDNSGASLVLTAYNGLNGNS